MRRAKCQEINTSQNGNASIYEQSAARARRKPRVHASIITDGELWIKTQLERRVSVPSSVAVAREVESAM